MDAASARPLRLGILGGGPESWIGRMHRSAAVLDGRFAVVAGVFSSDPERSRAAGRALGLEAGRAYGTLGTCSPGRRAATTASRRSRS